MLGLKYMFSSSVKAGSVLQSFQRALSQNQSIYRSPLFLNNSASSSTTSSSLIVFSHFSSAAKKSSSSSKLAPKKTQKKDVKVVATKADSAKKNSDNQREKDKKMKEAAKNAKIKKEAIAKKNKEQLKQKAEREREKLKKQNEKSKMELTKEKEKERKKLEKEEKDKRPKRAATALNLYVKKNFANFKSQSKDKEVTKLLPLMIAKFKSLSDSEKKPYVDEAKKDKSRYEKEKSVIAKNAPPKRPLTAYILFANDERGALAKQHPNLSLTDLTKKIGSKWRALSEKDKESWEGKAEKLKEEYQRKMEKFNQ